MAWLAIRFASRLGALHAWYVMESGSPLAWAGCTCAPGEHDTRPNNAIRSGIRRNPNTECTMYLQGLW
eukprot:XP_001701678.1 predicted protein [Chlamydomonas reinhardtii]